MAEDASALLADFVASLDNLPSEISHILSEITGKEERMQDHRGKINQRDSSIQKHHKANTLLTENPKESSHINKCRVDFVKAGMLADEKVALADRAVRLLSRHLSRLNVEMAKLQGLPPMSTTTTLADSSFYDPNPPPYVAPPEGASRSRCLPHSLLLISDQSVYNLEERKSLALDTSFSGIQASSPSYTSPSVNLTSAAQTQPISAITANSPASAQSFARPPRPSRLNSNLNISTHNVNTPIPRGASPSNPPSQPMPKRARTANAGLNRHSLPSARSAPKEYGEDNDEDAEGEDDDDMASSEPGETQGDDAVYCLCQKPSYGEMVGCDNAACQYEWFHYDCVGLKAPPAGKWYCPQCRVAMENQPARDAARRRR